MANDQNIRIGINTSADTSGAKETVTALAQVEDTTEKLQAQQKRGMAELEGQAEKARTAEFAFYDLDAEMRKTGKATETLTGGLTQLAPTTRNNAQALLMFSQGFEDAQYGIRGVLNNIPGLIMTLGGGAGLAGAISIAAVAGSALYSMLGGVEEKASDVAERIKEISANMADAETDRFEAAGKAIDAAAAETAARKQGWEETKEAEAAYSQSALSNAEKLKQAQLLIAEALGYQVDSFKELEAIAKRAEQVRNLTAQQAIATENERLKKVRDTVTVAGEEAQRQSELALNLQANLQRAQAELQLLKEKRAELTKIAGLATGGINFSGQGEAVSPDAARNFEAGSAAQAALESQVFQNKLAGTQDRVTRLEELVRSFNEEGTGIVAKAETALVAAQTKAADVSRAVETNISRIQETLAADETLARTQNLAQTGEAFAAEIKAKFSQIETSNERGKTALESLATAVSDGSILPSEMAQTAVDMRTLIGLLQSGQAESKTNILELIGLQKAFAQDQTNIRNEIENLKVKVGGLSSLQR